MRLLLVGTVARLAEQVVEFTVLGARQKRVDLRLSVEQDRAGRVPRVPHRDLARRQRGQFHSLPVWVAMPAFLPAHLAEFGGEHAVVRNDHVYPLSRGYARQAPRVRSL